MANFFPINTPLVNYFFYNAPLQQDGANLPLADGGLFFFDDNDHSVMLPTYSDVSDPNNPVVNPNPLRLGSAGECPLFYLEDRPYYIVITDSSLDIQNPVRTISHYNPADFTPPVGVTNNNFIASGQFTYPIQFYEDGQQVGEISLPTTGIAWGWLFYEDGATTTQNFVTFNDISSENIEGAPIFEAVLTSQNVMSGETTKDFRTALGTVNFMAGQVVTISMQLQSKLSGNTNVNIILEKYYGIGGSPQELVSLTTFVATPTRTKFVFSTTLPTNAGKIINDLSSLALRIQPGLGQICSVGITNVLMSPGNISDPVYNQEALGPKVASILGVSTDIEQSQGLPFNFSPYYYNDGIVRAIPGTGQITLFTTGQNPPYTAECNSQTLNVSGYDPATQIPFSRLYANIGNTYGSSGSLIATSSNNVVKIRSAAGAVQNSAYTAGTTSFTVTNTLPGLQFGVSGVKSASNQVTLTWTNNFAPDQTPSASPSDLTVLPGLIGYWSSPTFGVPANNIEIVTLDPGSGITPAIATVTFNNPNSASYKTAATGFSDTMSFLEFAAFANNTRGAFPNFTRAFFFAFDGSLLNPSNVDAPLTGACNFLTSNTLSQNVDAFLGAIANPFIWTITVTSPPTASQYFLFSSETTNYYGWFKVDGVGTDPMVGGRTGVEIDISSTDSTVQIAAKIAAKIDDFAFTLPGPSDLPALADDSKASWYIYL